ncbi:MarR family winged helix-turn-helix transcriptional regulator [Diplocloster modestus]|uniref:MarR family transcriptional regulator n=1 Tax=Diplocloster modestus TaxID=2850322 RepID=A0ABS6K4M7_9FIRM|nr:MarR family transcriptional regulator [Diplocloster modestus]MBU9725476.1 MarR family transcriptional regulator [Diplocloster modestus]
MDIRNIDQLYTQLNARGNLIYRFVLQYRDLMFERYDYGSGDEFNMLEIHTLTEIGDNPGTTVSSLSTIWNRTKGAISQVVTKLEDLGYVERRKNAANGKIVNLYLTPSGTRLSQLHKAYDSKDITETTTKLLSKCSMEEIDHFYKVLQAYISILEEN